MLVKEATDIYNVGDVDNDEGNTKYQSRLCVSKRNNKGITDLI